MPYSPEYVEGEFREVELPLYGVLGSSALGCGTLQRKEGDVVLLLPPLPDVGVELLHEEVLQRPLLLITVLGDECMWTRGTERFEQTLQIMCYSAWPTTKANPPRGGGAKPRTS
jgi:hypothetical protein